MDDFECANGRIAGANVAYGYKCAKRDGGLVLPDGGLVLPDLLVPGR